MGKGGLIIRLIDVAMIILFGFIAISDIKVRAQIRLPSSEQEEQEPEEQDEPVVLLVRISNERGYLIEIGDEAPVPVVEVGLLEQEIVRRVEQYRADGREIVVLVEPEEESIIQRTVDVLDICERNNIAKNINYESMQF